MLEDEPKIKQKHATIESLTTDMGNGASWCSGCKHQLDKYLNYYFSTRAEKRRETGLSPETNLDTFLQKNPLRCPKCNRYLTFGKIESYQFGGSDF